MSDYVAGFLTCVGLQCALLIAMACFYAIVCLLYGDGERWED